VSRAAASDAAASDAKQRQPAPGVTPCC
jgi:hypothetical protein